MSYTWRGIRWVRCLLLLSTILIGVVATLRLGFEPPAVARAAHAAMPAAGAPVQVLSRRPPAPACPAGPRGVLESAPGPGRTVALTFDDGPGPYTRPVLEVLRRYGIRATFFVVGQQVATHPDTVADIVADGHLLGDHTWSHRAPAPGSPWTTAALRPEIDRTETALEQVTGAPTCWFRPPMGVTQGLGRALRGHAMRVALWSVDTQDWRLQAGVTSDPTGAVGRAIHARAVAAPIQDNPVILLHDGGGYRGATVAALPSIIEFYRDLGYRFVRLDGQ